MILLIDSLGLFHDLGMRHGRVNALMPLQVLLDKFTQVDDWLFSDLDLQLVHSVLPLSQVKPLTVFLREQVAHIVAVVRNELVLYCLLHIIDLRLL